MRYEDSNSVSFFALAIAARRACLALLIAALSGSQVAMAQSDDGPVSIPWSRDQDPIYVPDPLPQPPPNNINCTSAPREPTLIISELNQKYNDLQTAIATRPAGDPLLTQLYTDYQALNTEYQ